MSNFLKQQKKFSDLNSITNNEGRDPIDANPLLPSDKLSYLSSEKFAKEYAQKLVHDFGDDLFSLLSSNQDYALLRQLDKLEDSGVNTFEMRVALLGALGPRVNMLKMMSTTFTAKANKFFQARAEQGGERLTPDDGWKLLDANPVGSSLNPTDLTVEDVRKLIHPQAFQMLKKAVLQMQLKQQQHEIGPNNPQLRQEHNKKIAGLFSKSTLEQLGISLDRPETLENIALFTQGPFGSGKSSIFEETYSEPKTFLKSILELIDGIFLPSGQSDKPNHSCDLNQQSAISADVAKTMIPLPLTSGQKHEMASQAAYESRKLMNNHSGKSYVMDSALPERNLNDVQDALDAGKKVVIKSNIVPLQQSVVRVLARAVNGKDPHIRLDHVMTAYRDTLNGIKKAREMAKENPNQMVQEVAGPNLVRQNNTDEFKIIAGRSGYEKKNQPLTDTELEQAIVTFTDWSTDEKVAALKNAKLSDVLSGNYFSEGEAKFLREKFESMERSHGINLLNQTVASAYEAKESVLLS